MVSAPWSVEYVKPARMKLTFKDLSEVTTYRTYDPFGSDGGLNVQSININLREGGFGDANITIFDDEDTFDRFTEGLRATVVLQMSKNGTDYADMLVATNPRLVTRRPDTGLLYKDIQCEGKFIMLDERLVNFTRHSAYANIDDSTQFSSADKMKANALITELMTKEKIMPLGSFQNSIQEHTKYDLLEISAKVNDFIASVDIELGTARLVADTIANSIGAVLRMGPRNNLIFEYPHVQHTGILISDDSCNPINHGWMSFPIGPWQYTDEWSHSAGNATSVIGKTDNPFDLSDSGSATNNARTSLFENDIAQQFPITTQDFAEIVVLIAKDGDPDTDDLHFHIVEDNGNAPTGKKIAEGNIDLDNVSDEPEPVFISKLKFKKKPKIGTNAWIILYRVESNDSEDTVFWYNDDGITATSAIRDLSGEPDPITIKKPNHSDNNDWVASVGTGPKYAYSIFDIASYLTYAYDYRAANRFGWVDKFIDFSFTSHTNVAMMAANAHLAELSKVRRTFDFPMLTLPDIPYVFYPDQWVTIHDTLSGLLPRYQYMFKVTSLNILISAIPDGVGGSALGARTCHVTGIGYADYLGDDGGDPSWG